MVDVVKTLPPEAGALSGMRRFVYAVILNRIQIGLFLLAVTGVIVAFIPDEDVKGHKKLRAIEALIVAMTGVSGVAIGGASFKSNSYHQRRMSEEIREKSGAWVPPHQRADDQPGNTKPMRRLDESTSVEEVISDEGQEQDEGDHEGGARKEGIIPPNPRGARYRRGR